MSPSRALLEGGAKIHPADHQGPVLYRPLNYIATAIAETCTTKEDTDKMIEKYCEFVASIRQFHLDRAVKSIPVRRKGHNWLRTIGRRLRRSLSSSKSLHPSLEARPAAVGETDDAPSAMATTVTTTLRSSASTATGKRSNDSSAGFINRAPCFSVRRRRVSILRRCLAACSSSSSFSPEIQWEVSSSQASPTRQCASTELSRKSLVTTLGPT
ncbi:hypothetical protein B0T26DRAFT_680809 [Lasiosphaeria miniovina]|uniref:Uncharacterized protein n=1 Tax=Lasiosphaeria miniovina TaxID=1954250 RepID=A0AA40DIY4_9PEZI|nr:uncharacterized protein B0T26DRAFT_680809 [Lasiosphaeria miniovina]KAK0703056.1 hypothetical protein B0T26DRAFT_680809 [Lasiosphaeria miniovina]